jgi:hypothetical protein
MSSTTTRDPSLSLSSLTATQSADLGFSKDAYLTSLFSGAAVYSYPIDVPKGIAGLQPKIDLTYNSQSVGGTYGWLGDGWSLNDFYVLRDVNYTPNDISDDRFKLIFDGQSHNLIYSETDGFYHTEIETYMRIQRVNGGSNQKGEYWIVTTKDGTEYRFGYTGDSELLNSVPSRDYVSKWKLDQIKDLNGNLIAYNYDKNPMSGEVGTSYLKNISYNNGFNVIEFERSNKPVTFNEYRDGSQISEKCLLSAISIKAGNQLVYQYQIQYAFNNHVLLDSISVIGADSTGLPATTFSYDIINNSFVHNSTWSAFFPAINLADHNVRVVDLNDDGLPDLVQAYSRISNGNTINVRNVWINTGNGFVYDPTWSASFPVTFANDQSVQIIDLNNDGLPDVVQSYYRLSNGNTIHVRNVWINTGNGFVHNPVWSASFPTAFTNDQSVQFIDLNGDGLPDIVQAYSYISNGNTINVRNVWINTGNGFVHDPTWSASFPTTFTNNQSVQFIDLNGNGLPDVVQAYSYISNGNTINVRNVWINTAN